jgi:hypothetical protein
MFYLIFNFLIKFCRNSELVELDRISENILQNLTNAEILSNSAYPKVFITKYFIYILIKINYRKDQIKFELSKTFFSKIIFL